MCMYTCVYTHACVYILTKLEDHMLLSMWWIVCANKLVKKCVCKYKRCSSHKLYHLIHCTHADPISLCTCIAVICFINN